MRCHSRSTVQHRSSSSCCHSLPYSHQTLIERNWPHPTRFHRGHFRLQSFSSASARQVSIYLHPQTQSSSYSPRHRHPLPLRHVLQAVLEPARRSLRASQTLSDLPAQATYHIVRGRDHPWNGLWKESTWRVPNDDGFAVGHSLERSGCTGYRELWEGYVILTTVTSWGNHFGGSHYDVC